MSKFTDLLENINSGKIKDDNGEALTFEEVDSDVLSTERFRYPDMGDFYLNAVKDPYFKRLKEAMDRLGINEDGSYDGDGVGEDSNVESGLNKNSEIAMSFYYEAPPIPGQMLGDYQDKGVVFIKGKVEASDEDKEMGYFDADTFSMHASTIEAGDQKTKDLIIGSYTSKLMELGVKKDPQIKVRLVGVDAPEVAHWDWREFESKDLEKRTKKVRYSEVVKDHEHYIIYRADGMEDGEIDVCKPDPNVNKWHEYRGIRNGSISGYKELKILTKMDETDPLRIREGKRVQDKVQKLIQAAGGEVYFMIDRVSLNKSNATYPTIYDGVDAFSTGLDKIAYYWSQVKDYNRFKYSGFNQWGQDKWGRWMGAAYVKLNGQWINIAKYIITQSKEVETLPDYTSLPSMEAYGGSPASIFGLNTYDYENRVVFDVHSEIAKELDDRRRVQEDIFNIDFDKMKEWNVTIGDCTFFVPPTSIRVNQQMTHERLPILRGKGSMTKGSQKVQKMIELTLYFNEERGINGYPYKDKLPNGKETTYYMNGLRSLIAQFKFTPFLPIENDYINRILNIDAVTLVNLQVVTNPSMPRLLTCVLTLHEFDYVQYMPEIPLDLDNIDQYYNPFATTFNFGLMRWYYQKAIQRGEELKDYSVNDKKYIEVTEGSRTALFPMKFEDPGFKIYVANEDHLDQMFQAKIQKMNHPNRTYNSIGQKEKDLIKDLSPIYNAFLNLESDALVKNAIKGIMDLESKENQSLAISVLQQDNMTKKSGPKLEQNWLRVDEKVGDKYITVKKASEVTPKLNDLVSATAIAMYQANIQKPLLSLSQTYMSIKDKKALIGIAFKVNSEHMNEGALQSIIDAAEIQIGANKSLNEWIKTGHIVVEYEIPLKEKKSIKLDNIAGTSGTAVAKYYEVDGKIKISNGENTQFIAAISSFQSAIEGKGNATINDEIEGLGQDIDFNMLETLSYEEVLLGDIRIKNIACSYGNNFTQIGLNGTEGYTAQYLGGQDTVIELGIETTDETSVGMLNGLPKLASYIVTKYRLIMPSAPIRFESEITRLLGVMEVVIENIEISTVPGQPGLYQINMRLVSIDRTIRHREGIRRVNEVANGGVTTNGGIRDIKLRNFEELQTRFGEAELYPDLELPTIKELENSGFDFLRHKFDHTRVYPDPDFYFNYGYVLLSELYREAVMCTDLDTYEVKYSNKDGDYVVTQSAKGVGVEESEKSENVQTYENACSKAEAMAGPSSSKKINTYIENHIPVLNMLDTASSEDVWEIGPDVRVMLMEEPYAKMLATHERGLAKGETIKETEWLYNKLKDVREAVKLIDKALSKPMNTSKLATISIDSSARWLMKAKASSIIMKYSNIFSKLGVSDFGKMSKVFGELVYAAACAKTGNKEYRSGLDKKEYEPDLDFIGYKVSSAQDSAGIERITDPNDVVNAVEFGPFRLKMYSDSEIRAILGTKEITRRFDKDASNINTYMFLLDPYYRTKATLKEIADYKKTIIADTNFAIEAFLRNCLVWLKKLIEDKLFPNLNFDILSKDFENELESAEWKTEFDSGKKLDRSEEKQISEQIDQYIDFLKDIERPMDGGKMFLLVSLAVCEMDLYKFIQTRSFKELNQLKTTLTSTSVQFENGKSEHMELRRFLFALIPAKVIEGIEDLSTRNEDTMQKYRRVELDRKYIEFADDPDIYTRHAFYDMCVHDMRGRMARAFPSFYIVLVDEGQEIGMYKLNDNFYNVNSISEIQVHKSRKIPADTCRIVMSNLFHTFTQDDEDKVIEYEYSPLDVFNSIFHPGEIYGKEQEKRLRQQPLNKVKLTPGTRIHVRMGYGANAATLPIAFNGKITEVNAGDVMEIICQGDGIELAQPIMEDLDADEVDNADKMFGWFLDLFDNASTPKEILTGLLTLKGSYWQEAAKKVTNGLIKNPHRYGYVNFGDINYTDVFKNGEAVQNIFEAIGKPMWGSVEDGVESNFNLKEAPKISMELMGKSFWDVLHICASATPDFIGAIAPFGMRSTVFHGHPRYYYAFDYVISESGGVYEKRKPFQQYHIVTSYSDIIANNIKADASRIKTNAIGTFKAAGNTGLMGTRINKTPRMYVDWDIYPENQKSMIYDTQFYDKGIPMSFGVGKAIQWVDKIVDYFQGEEKGEKAYGVIQNGYPIAKRMTANALKNSMKDMYDGELVLMGIPSLKPHDRLQILDIYENMDGQVLVEAVTHSLTVETGLTSTVVPDCISVIDDQFEKGTRGVMSYIVQASTIAYAAVFATSVWITKGKGYKPLTKLVSGGGAKIAENTGKIVSKVGNAVSSPGAKGAKAAAKAARYADDVARAIRTIGTATVAGGGLPGFVAGLAWFAVEAGISFTIGQLFNMAVQEAIKNAQVLTVFPLKHNGKVMTAGLTGSVGLVYGSTNYNKLGALESAFTYLDTETNGLGKGVNFIIDMIVNDETQAAARKYAARAIDSTADEDVEFETNLQDTLKGLASKEARRASGYERLLISPRVQSNDKDIKAKYEKVLELYGLMDTRMLEAQQRIVTENIYIKNDVEIEKMMSKDGKGFLKNMWDDNAPSAEYEMKTFSIGGKQVQIKVFKKNGGEQYDLPFLKDEALSLLKVILSEARKLMPSFEPEKEMINDSSIMISSALLVGGKKRSIANTGYCFTLEASGTGADEFLIKAIKNIYDFGVNEYKAGRSPNPELFAYKHIGGNKYQIAVYPPDLGV